MKSPLSKLLFILVLSLTFALLFSCDFINQLILGSPPTVTISEPTNNTSVTTTTVTISGTVTDPDGNASSVSAWITGYESSINGDDIYLTNNAYSLDLDLSTLSSGNYEIIVQGYDANDNESDLVSVNITYTSGGGGGTGNAPQIIMSSPANNDTIYVSTVYFTGNIKDPDGDLKTLSITCETDPSIHGSFSLPAGTVDYNYSVSVDITSPSDGPYTFNLVAQDSNAHTDLKSVTIIYSGPGTAPVLNHSNPGNSTTITISTVDFSGTVSDSDGDLQKVYVKCNEEPSITGYWPVSGSNDSYTISLDLSTLAPGNYTFTIGVQDSKNNTDSIVISLNYNPI